jgi:hypothetical protein
VLNPDLIDMYAREQQRDLALEVAAARKATAAAATRPRRSLTGLLDALRRQRQAPEPMTKPMMKPAAGTTALR